MDLKSRMLCLAISVIIILFFTGSDKIRAETPGKTEGKTLNQTTSGNQKEPNSVGSYIFISEKNLFHPERKDFPIQPASQEGNKPAMRPQITLYGIVITKDYQSASMAVAGRPLKKGEREIMNFKVGDTIVEYKLTKILPDRIVMEGTGDSFEVLLYDSKTAKRRGDVKTANKPVTVTNPIVSQPRSPQIQAPTKEVPKTSPKPAHETSPSYQTTSEKTTELIKGMQGSPTEEAPQMPVKVEPPMKPTPIPPSSIPAPSVVTPPMSPTPVPVPPMRRVPRSRNPN